MKYTVIGYQRKQGNYQGYDYDNYVISCVRPADKQRGEDGQIVEILKIKARFLQALPELGTEIEPIYNSYGNCVGFNVV